PSVSRTIAAANSLIVVLASADPMSLAISAWPFSLACRISRAMATAAVGATPLQMRACDRRRAGRSGPLGPDAMTMLPSQSSWEKATPVSRQPAQRIEGDEPARVPADDDVP